MPLPLLLHSLRLYSPLAAALVAACLGCATTANAQDSSGTLVGVVADAGAGTALPGAEVRLTPQYAAVTAKDGSYAVRGVPAGTYTATITYLGYAPLTQSVTIAAGERVSRDFGLKWEESVVTLGAFSVTAEVDADARALNRQRTASSLVNVVSSDALGNLPDAQVADALRRVSGISTIRVRGEGNTIVVRGTEASVNSINLDGVAVQSNAADGLTVGLDMFLVDQLASINVVKSVTPDLPADTFGAYINLETKSPLDFKRTILTANADVYYNDQFQKFSPRAGVTYLTQLGSRKQFGLSITAAYQERLAEAWRNNVNWRSAANFAFGGTTYPVLYVPNQVEHRVNFSERERGSLAVGLDWRPTERTKLFFKSSINRQEEFTPGERLRLTWGATAGNQLDATKPFRVVGLNLVEGTTTPSGTARGVVERTVTAQFTNDTAMVFQAGGSTDLDRLKINYSASFSKTENEFDQVFAGFDYADARMTFTLDEAIYPRISTDNPAKDFNQPGNYRLRNVDLLDSIIDNNEYTFKGDAAYTADLFGRPVTFKAGGSFRTADKDRNSERLNSLNTTSNGVSPDRRGTFFLDNPMFVQKRLPSDFLGRYDLGVGPEAKSFHAYARGLLRDGNYVRNANGQVDGFRDDYGVRQDITSAYGMVDFKIGPVYTVAGGRLENTKDTAEAFAVRNVGGVVTAIPVRGERDYDFFSPNINLRMPFAEKFQARASYNETMRRPSSIDAAPRITFNDTSTPISVGGFNPRLKQQLSTNFDLSLDWFYSKHGRTSVALFQKNIEDTFFSRDTTGPLSTMPEEVQLLLANRLPTETVRFTERLNGGDGEIRGIEFEFQQRLRFLPGLFSALSLGGNATIVESEWKRPDLTTRTQRFPQQSKTTGNLYLDYARGRWYARIAYNWRDEYLSSVNAGDPNLDLWGGNAASIDVKLTYQIRENWMVQFQAQNLKNDSDTSWSGADLTRVNQLERSGTDYSVGVRWKL